MRIATCAAMFVAAAGALRSQEPGESTPSLRREVQLLLSRQTRDDALGAILTRGEHRGPGTYTEAPGSHRVRHVVMCPQARGLPIFAVFVRGLPHDNDYQDAKGHLIMVASDGAIVRAWRGDNLVQGVFEDVNDDGIIDRVDTISCAVEGGIVRELYVLPITEEATAALRVGIDFQATGASDEWRTAWRVLHADGGQPARIQIGPRDPATGALAKVQAEWRWHAARSAWVGPGGGPDQPFVRLPPEGWPALEEFAAAQIKARDEHTRDR